MLETSVMFHVKHWILGFYIFLVLALLTPSLVSSQDFEEANELCFQGKQEEATSAYLQAIEKEPTKADIWVNLAIAYRDLGLYPEAITSLRHASRILFPEQTAIFQKEILGLLAWLYYYSGKIEEAENTFRQIISLNTNSVSALFGLGRISTDKKDWLEAEKRFKKIVADNPTFAPAYYFLGLTYENQNRLEEATRMYQQTLRTDSKLVETYLALGRVYEKQKLPEEAYKQYQRILDIDPLNTEAKKKKEEVTPLLARRPEEVERKNKIFNFSAIKTPKERAKIPLLRIGTGSDEKGAPFPTEKIFIRSGSNFLVLKKKSEEVILKSSSSLQILAKKSGKLEVVDSNGKNIGEYEEPIIVRLEKSENGTMIVEEVPYGKSFAWATTEDREYRGETEIIPDKKYGLISVNVVNLGEYLYSVLPSELYSSAPKEALKAQAVVARSIALFKQKHRKPHKNFGYDLCDEQHCQVYRGVKMETERARQAVDETRGEILIYEDKVLNALFSANCGGHTQSASDLKGWGDEPCLTGVFDGEKEKNLPKSPYELEKWIKNKPQVYCNYQAENFQPTKFRWVRITPAKDIEERINREYAVGRIQRVIPLRRSKSGHLQKLKIVGEKDEIVLDKEYEIRKILGLGFLRSTLFILETKFNGEGFPEEFIFWGGGWGHGVGMCQFGACGMATKGYNYKQILKHYYQGSEILNLKY